MEKGIEFLANGHAHFINLTLVAIMVVMVWIGGLKAFQYEAEGSSLSLPTVP